MNPTAGRRAAHSSPVAGKITPCTQLHQVPPIPLTIFYVHKAPRALRGAGARVCARQPDEGVGPMSAHTSLVPMSSQSPCGLRRALGSQLAHWHTGSHNRELVNSQSWYMISSQSRYMISSQSWYTLLPCACCAMHPFTNTTSPNSPKPCLAKPSWLGYEGRTPRLEPAMLFCTRSELDPRREHPPPYPCKILLPVHPAMRCPKSHHRSLTMPAAGAAT